MPTTPVSLLVRLKKPGDDQAWQRFVALYTPLLLYWARRLQLQEADAADLVQDVLSTLVVALPAYERQQGSRFRGWLWTVLQNKHRERLRKIAARPGEAGPTLLDEAATSDQTQAFER